MDDLATRCEEANEADRVLDQDLGCASGRFTPLPPKNEFERDIIFALIGDDGSVTTPGNGAGDGLVPRYTASIDKALSLVPDGWHTFLAMQDRHSQRWQWELRWAGYKAQARGQTAPLAICAAARKAATLLARVRASQTPAT